MVAQIKVLAGGLREVAGKAEQEIGERRAGFRAVDTEGPVEGAVGIFVDLIVVKLAAELQSVVPTTFETHR